MFPPPILLLESIERATVETHRPFVPYNLNPATRLTQSSNFYQITAITRLALEDVFAQTKKDTTRDYTLKMSFVEIYNEVMTNLCCPM